MVSITKKKKSYDHHVDQVCDKLKDIAGVKKVNRAAFESIIGPKLEKMVNAVRNSGEVTLGAEKVYVQNQIYDSIAREVFSYGKLVDREKHTGKKFVVGKEALEALETKYKSKPLDTALNNFISLKQNRRKEKGQASKGGDVTVNDINSFLGTVQAMVDPESKKIVGNERLIEAAIIRLQEIEDKKLRPSEREYLTRQVASEFVQDIRHQERMGRKVLKADRLKDVSAKIQEFSQMKTDAKQENAANKKKNATIKHSRSAPPPPSATEDKGSKKQDYFVRPPKPSRPPVAPSSMNNSKPKGHVQTLEEERGHKGRKSFELEKVEGKAKREGSFVEQLKGQKLELKGGGIGRGGPTSAGSSTV